MKRAILLFTLLALALVTTLAVAAGPKAGTYRTLDGKILTGRASESMPCDMCEGQLGNMITAKSFNGASLGDQWRVTCAQVSSAPELILDTVVGGTGQRIYRTHYSGGILWLGWGVWNGGDPYNTGPITTMTLMVTKQYVSGNLVGAVSNINLSGTFDGYTSCFDMAIANAYFAGATPGTPMICCAFPAFAGPSDCALVGTHGTWWDVQDITLSIIGTCEVVGTRTSTWGTLKSLYR